ncbi:MAG TPA: hypothetical protein VEV42_08035, partial [Pyrinomonadaceae bacterium]|nr:hypothetical protein [Pyrinomonadaceae bacterium]
ARGGFEVDLSWRNGALGHATIRSINGISCLVRYRDKVIPLRLRLGATIRLDLKGGRFSRSKARRRKALPRF